jgi:hypothetical protein
MRNTIPSRLSAQKDRRDFDVFLAHNSKDKCFVKLIAERLKSEGLRPWLDEEQIRPGQAFLDAIQDAIPRCRSAAVMLGPAGLGRWQTAELRSLVAQFVEKGVPVIPVLLPGLDDVPAPLSFLRQFRYVAFCGSEDDEEAYGLLIWGITDIPPAQDKP